ncbi:hypothetical protein [Psychroserpens ponticola]|uniref:DUF898 family protein n=1 Tax=Psychroserpens ponticola TaxID=2932268 RepID=A0ABY7S411_9FLAO|nr:hypothetical protein [Psychroserpens ponticola]WCO02640.1 hypothetical protein MUN68_003885 [Psychroserpens ponticola]
MDELELLKKDWKNEDKVYPKLSYKEIYNMILSKSSSIVKWIFIISILEFVFWVFISFGLKASGFNLELDGMEKNAGFIAISIFSYAILAYFFYRFYINYKTINTTDNAKVLMENILKTRRTVKQYVFFNLLVLVIGVSYMMPYALKSDEDSRVLLETAQANGELFKYYASIALVTIIGLVIAISVLLLFYWLIYGILLKRLNRNYYELKKLEV